MASVQKRGNSWLLVVETGIGPDGKRIKRTRTIKADGIREARKKLAEFQTEVEAGEYIAPNKMTFAAFVEDWRMKYAEQADGLSALTLKNYASLLKNRIVPVFGHLQIGEIKTMHIVNFINDLKSPGSRKSGEGESISLGTVLYIYKVLKNVLSYAVKWQLISKNPMEGVKKPKVEQEKMQYFDGDEAPLVIEALFKEPTIWRLFCLGSLLGGFRRGELLGLEWQYVNYEEHSISIQQSISLTENGEAIVKSPKTESSQRIVDMPEWYMRELKDFHHQSKINRLKLGDAWQGGERSFVFQSGYGKPYYYNTPSLWWRKFLRRHKLKPVRLHDLRHSAASLLIEDGVDLKTIQERLGHKKYQTTADIYAHISKKVKKESASKLDKFDPSKIIRQQTVNIGDY
jgi:integrase